MKKPNPKAYRKVDKASVEITRLIEKIDFSDLKLELAQLGWNDEQIAYVLGKYRNFLYLCATTGDVIIPTHEIDIVWHIHILDTIKYRNDCEAVFGFYLDHYPYLGKRGDREEFDAAFEATCQIYEVTFGEPYRVAQAISLVPGLASRIAKEDGANCG